MTECNAFPAASTEPQPTLASTSTTTERCSMTSLPFCISSSPVTEAPCIRPTTTAAETTLRLPQHQAAAISTPHKSTSHHIIAHQTTPHHIAPHHSTPHHNVTITPHHTAPQHTTSQHDHAQCLASAHLELQAAVSSGRPRDDGHLEPLLPHRVQSRLLPAGRLTRGPQAQLHKRVGRACREQSRRGDVTRCWMRGDPSKHHRRLALTVPVARRESRPPMNETTCRKR